MLKSYSATDCCARIHRPRQKYYIKLRISSNFYTSLNLAAMPHTQVNLRWPYFKVIFYRNKRIFLHNSQIRDSAALVEFVAGLEKDVKEGLKEWDEISASDALDNLRK